MKHLKKVCRKRARGPTKNSNMRCRESDYYSRGFKMVTRYCKVVRSRLSQLVAHSRILRLFMKRKFDAYVL